MNTPLTVWGLVLLVAFTGAHYMAGSYSAAWLWVGIAVVIILLSAWVGKNMKASKGSTETWMALSVFGFITTLVVAFGLISVSMSWLMSLWLLLLGAAIYSEGHARNNQPHIYSGLVVVVAALLVPGFGSSYFLACALFVGLGGLISGLLAKSK